MIQRLVLLIILMTLSTLPASAAESPIPLKEKAINFGIVYLAQWSFYGISQYEVIRDHGRLVNLIEYPFKPNFDKDGFDYNIFKHSIAGHYYYLFYRSRNYSRKQAFLASFASSLAFEFAVETLTERPSYQDIYLTPVFGTALGLTVENASARLRGSSSSFLTVLGYILNPFALANGESVSLVIPSWSPQGSGVYFVGEF